MIGGTAEGLSSLCSLLDWIGVGFENMPNLIFVAIV